MSKFSLVKYKGYISLLSHLAVLTNILVTKEYYTVLNGLKRLLSFFHVYYYPICHGHDFSYDTKLKSMTVDRERLGAYSNVVFGDVPSDNTLIPKRLPDLQVKEYHNVIITGQSQFIYDLRSGVIVNDFDLLYDENLYENVDSTLRLQKSKCALLNRRLEEYKREIEEGIMISGNFAFNYYHTLFENYIKIIAFEKADIPATAPFIVDSIFTKYESYQEILKALNTKGREIIPIDKHESVKISRLYTIGPVNILPPQAKDINNTRAEDVVYDISYLKIMRERLLKLKSDREFCKRVFISRKGNTRRSWNEEAVFELLKREGFQQYSPQDLSFAEQISLFNNAEFIIGGSGAALSNLLFCSKGCKVICVYSERVNIPVFSTLAYMNGATMRYVVGNPIKGSSVSNTHSDFTVDTSEVQRVLRNMLEGE